MLRPRFAGTVGKNRKASRQNVARAAGRLGTKNCPTRTGKFRVVGHEL